VPDAHQGTKIFLPKFLWTSPIPIPSISMLKKMIGLLGGVFHFQGGLHAIYMRILWYHKYHRKIPFRSKFSTKFFYILMNANPTIPPNFVVIRGFVFFCLFGMTPPKQVVKFAIKWYLKIDIGRNGI
jgi:hypothetical protein